MRKLVLFLFIGLSLTVNAKKVIVPSATIWIDASASPYNTMVGGDTLVITVGNKTYLAFKNFKGTATSPIVVINQGEVIIDTGHYFGIKIANCQYLKVTGTGTPGLFYGFNIKKVSGGAGLSIGELSSDVEIDHISIDNTILAGIFAKTDPTCGYAERANFTQYNTIIHDCYVGHSGDEGMYIGSTKYDGITAPCGTATKIYPSVLKGVRIYNNIVEGTGWDGIQVSSAVSDCKIYNNVIKTDSQDGTDSQMSGIMLGGGTQAECYNNLIIDGKGCGIEYHGIGGSRIYNNVIVNAGKTYNPTNMSLPKHGMYISDNTMVAGASMLIYNNTIINPKSDGIRYSSTKSKGDISANVIINPGAFTLYETDNTAWTGNDSYIMAQGGTANITGTTNYFNRDATIAKFISSSDFHLTATSPLIDKSDVVLSFDKDGNKRPVGLKSDIGAYEYGSVVTPPVEPPVVVVPPVVVPPVVTVPLQPKAFIVSTTKIIKPLLGVVYTVPDVVGVTYRWTYSGRYYTLRHCCGNTCSVDFFPKATSGTLSVVAVNEAGTSIARTISITVK